MAQRRQIYCEPRLEIVSIAFPLTILNRIARLAQFVLQAQSGFQTLVLASAPVLPNVRARQNLIAIM